jgi:hypothetical protein
MKRVSTTSIALPPTDVGAVGKAWHEASASFDRFCLAAGIDALGAMMEKDAEDVCGARHCPRRGTARTPLGPYPRQDCLSCRQGDGRAAARARPRGSWRCRAGMARSRRTGSASGVPLGRLINSQRKFLVRLRPLMTGQGWVRRDTARIRIHALYDTVGQCTVCRLSTHVSLIGARERRCQCCDRRRARRTLLRPSKLRLGTSAGGDW